MRSKSKQIRMRNKRRVQFKHRMDRRNERIAELKKQKAAKS